MTIIWKYRFDNRSCGSGGTVRYTPVRIWRGFWLFCHDTEPLSSWCFREYRYQRGSTRHMQALLYQIDWTYVLGFCAMTNPPRLHYRMPMQVSYMRSAAPCRGRIPSCREPWFVPDSYFYQNVRTISDIIHYFCNGPYKHVTWC